MTLFPSPECHRNTATTDFASSTATAATTAAAAATTTATVATTNSTTTSATASTIALYEFATTDHILPGYYLFIAIRINERVASSHHRISSESGRGKNIIPW